MSVKTSVILRLGGDPMPNESHCEWMPYQQQQAARNHGEAQMQKASGSDAG